MLLACIRQAFTLNTTQTQFAVRSRSTAAARAVEALLQKAVQTLQLGLLRRVGLPLRVHHLLGGQRPVTQRCGKWHTGHRKANGTLGIAMGRRLGQTGTQPGPNQPRQCVRTMPAMGPQPESAPAMCAHDASDGHAA